MTGRLTPSSFPAGITATVVRQLRKHVVQAPSLRRFVTLPMALLLCGLLLVAASVGAQEPGRRSARDVRLRIETDRTTYQVGDWIAVRLSRNTSPEPVRYVSNPPVVHARLRVLDADGRQVEPAFPLVWQRLRVNARSLWRRGKR